MVIPSPLGGGDILGLEVLVRKSRGQEKIIPFESIQKGPEEALHSDRVVSWEVLAPPWLQEQPALLGKA